MRHALHIYDPDVYKFLASYIVLEDGSLRAYDDSESELNLPFNQYGRLIEHLAAFTISSLNGEFVYRQIALDKRTANSTREAVPKDDFERAVNRLRKFIKSSFSLEEIIDT